MRTPFNTGALREQHQTKIRRRTNMRIFTALLSLSLTLALSASTANASVGTPQPDLEEGSDVSTLAATGVAAGVEVLEAPSSLQVAPKAPGCANGNDAKNGQTQTAPGCKSKAVSPKAPKASHAPVADKPSHKPSHKSEPATPDAPRTGDIEKAARECVARYLALTDASSSEQRKEVAVRCEEIRKATGLTTAEFIAKFGPAKLNHKPEDKTFEKKPEEKKSTEKKPVEKKPETTKPTAPTTPSAKPVSGDAPLADSLARECAYKYNALRNSKTATDAMRQSVSNLCQNAMAATGLKGDAFWAKYRP